MQMRTAAQAGPKGDGVLDQKTAAGNDARLVARMLVGLDQLTVQASLLGGPVNFPSRPQLAASGTNAEIPDSFYAPDHVHRVD